MCFLTFSNLISCFSISGVICTHPLLFLVALPLCLGIALASGAAPIAGLIGGIIGGIIVAPISGSHVGVSGPTASWLLVTTASSWL